jgi:zona occludens toxin (predicted ATPase)
LKCKTKHALKRKFNAASNEKNDHHPTFMQYKKSPNNLFYLYRMKNNYITEKEKKIQEEKK